MIIGLSGRKRTGKDTTAAAFIAAHPEYSRVSFAGPLYRAAEKIDPIITGVGFPSARLSALRQVLSWDEIKDGPWGDGARNFLINLGMAMREEVDPNIWLDTALPNLKGAALRGWQANHHIIVTDVRFPNEAQRIKDLGGIVLRVQRIGVEEPKGPDISESETALDDWPFDGYVINDGVPEDAARRVHFFANNR